MNFSTTGMQLFTPEISYKVEKRVAGSRTFYSPNTGAAGAVYNGTSDYSPTGYWTSTRGFALQEDTPYTDNTVILHWVCDADI